MAADRRTLVVFDLAGRSCALPAEAVREVLHMVELARPPGLPRVIEGLVNIAGTSVPVLRLDRLFDLPESACELYTPLIVLKRSDPPLALMAHAMRSIMSVDAGDLVALAEDDTFNGCGEARLSAPWGDVTLLAADRLLLARERRQLAESLAQAEARLRQMETQP